MARQQDGVSDGNDVHKVGKISKTIPDRSKCNVNCTRFSYIQFASGLLKDAGRLLYILVATLTSSLIVNRLINGPVAETWKETYYLDMLKGKFCIREDITMELENKFIDISVKPKLFLMFNCFLYQFWFTFFFVKALKYR